MPREMNVKNLNMLCVARYACIMLTTLADASRD